MRFYFSFSLSLSLSHKCEQRCSDKIAHYYKFTGVFVNVAKNVKLANCWQKALCDVIHLRRLARSIVVWLWLYSSRLVSDRFLLRNWNLFLGMVLLNYFSNKKIQSSIQKSRKKRIKTQNTKNVTSRAVFFLEFVISNARDCLQSHTLGITMNENMLTYCYLKGSCPLKF